MVGNGWKWIKVDAHLVYLTVRMKMKIPWVSKRRSALQTYQKTLALHTKYSVQRILIKPYFSIRAMTVGARWSREN